MGIGELDPGAPLDSPIDDSMNSETATQSGDARTATTSSLNFCFITIELSWDELKKDKFSTQ